MYEIKQCPPNDIFNTNAWEVFGPGVCRFLAHQEDAERLRGNLEAAYHEGQLAAYRDACKRITDWKPRPETETVAG